MVGKEENNHRRHDSKIACVCVRTYIRKCNSRAIFFCMKKKKARNPKVNLSMRKYKKKKEKLISRSMSLFIIKKNRI
jgi:hypothetical protein